jgi:aminoglycoside phosphotransferase family enzyme/predicted kinase
VSQPLIDALQNPAIYPHPVEGFQVIETHISWVILTGQFAYKVKKAVNFGFLDFTELSERQHFCSEELRLNSRMTDNIYLEVVPITGTVDAPILGGNGAAIEYALKMKQFPQSDLLAEVQARGELTASHVDSLAGLIANFHQRAPQVPASHPLASVEAIAAPMRQNFEQARALLTDKCDLVQLDTLEAWTETNIERLAPLLSLRARTGAIRECHGDLHLGNATLLDGVPAVFDCIEFNEPFRLIDIAADAAFVVMDLEDRDLKPLARRFVSLWLEKTGDYEALPLLNLYKAYRAMVRAKVNLFRLGQEQDPVQRAYVLRQYRRYAELAENYAAIPSRFLAITNGFSAVGKSQVAMRLVESLGAVRIRSDVERKRLYNEGAPELYGDQATSVTYGRLHDIARTGLSSGHSIIIDATYLKEDHRTQVSQIAEDHGVPFVIVDCHAPNEVIAQWLEQRQREGGDPSDATLDVIKQQQASQEPLTPTEKDHSWKVDTNDASSLDSLIARIRQRLPGL